MTNTAFTPELLKGSTPFYSRDWYESSLKEWNSGITYSISLKESNTESKTIRVFKNFLKLLFFVPFLCYRGLQLLARVLIIPTTLSFFHKSAKNQILTETSRRKFSSTGTLNFDTYKTLPLTVEVDGMKIDAAIIGTEETLKGKRWLLRSNGNEEMYAHHISNEYELCHFINQFKSNIVLFNTPDASECKERITPELLAKVYRAMLSFLEDQKNGAQAQEIIGYGFSIGGAIQAKALDRHELKEGIKYVFIKDRTFSDLVTTVNTLLFPPLGFLVKFLGWNMDTANSSKSLRAPEIIIQTINDKGFITGDGVISEKASLGGALQEHLNSPRKKIIGVRETHTTPFYPGTDPLKTNSSRYHVDASLNYVTNKAFWHGIEHYINLFKPLTDQINDFLSDEYKRDPHINMKNLKSYVEKSQNRANSLETVLKDTPQEEIKLNISFFGEKQIQVKGAGTVPLRWIEEIGKENETLKKRVNDYNANFDTLLKTKGKITQFLARFQK